MREFRLHENSISPTNLEILDSVCKNSNVDLFHRCFFFFFVFCGCDASSIVARTRSMWVLPRTLL